MRIDVCDKSVRQKHIGVYFSLFTWRSKTLQQINVSYSNYREVQSKAARQGMGGLGPSGRRIFLVQYGDEAFHLFAVV